MSPVVYYEFKYKNADQFDFSKLLNGENSNITEKILLNSGYELNQQDSSKIYFYIKFFNKM